MCQYNGDREFERLCVPTFSKEEDRKLALVKLQQMSLFSNIVSEARWADRGIDEK